MLSDEEREEWKRDDRKAFRAAMMVVAAAAVFALADWEARADDDIPVCNGGIAEIKGEHPSPEGHLHYMRRMLFCNERWKLSLGTEIAFAGVR